MPEVDSVSAKAAQNGKRPKGKMVQYSVHMLDGSVLNVDMEKDAKGGQLFDVVVKSLDLFEVDYFDLSYVDRHGLKKWLTRNERIRKQVPRAVRSLRFEVKFYPTDPSQLHEDLTRYLLCLQVHKNIVEDKLPCSFYTYALLASYFVQAHLGDFDSPVLQAQPDYMSRLQFPSDRPDLLTTIQSMHKERKGLTPAEAEMNYLETAKKLALYGVELHPAISEATGDAVTLGICAAGVLVLTDRLRLHRFAWQRIYKVSYFRSHFNLQIHSGADGGGKTVAKYILTSTRQAKAAWKSCVAHHVFFRLMAPDAPAKHGLFKFGSTRLHCPGRTQYQTRLASNTCPRPPPRFQRSFRGVCRALEDGHAPQVKEAGQVVVKRNGPGAVMKVNESVGSNTSMSSSPPDSEAHSVVIQTFVIPESKMETLHYDDANLVNLTANSTNGGHAVSDLGNGNSVLHDQSTVAFSSKHQSFSVPVKAAEVAYEEGVTDHDEELSVSLLRSLVMVDSEDQENDLALLKAIYDVTGLSPHSHAVKVEVTMSTVQTETEV